MAYDAQLTFRVDLPGGQTRLREAILYVSEKCREADRFGKTKLNKILWRADFEAFARRGVPVTGRAYQRLKAGPAPVEMAPILGEMIRDELIEITKTQFATGKAEERPVPKVQASLRFFSPDDLKFIDNSIKFHWNKTGSEASDASHGVAWKTRSDLDAMPYELSYLSDEKMHTDDTARFSKMGSQRKWTTL